MSVFKKIAVGLATVFTLAAAPVQAQFGDPYNPANPMNPVNPLSPYNPNGIYYSDDDAPSGPMTTTDKWVLGSIAGVCGLGIAGLFGYMAFDEKIDNAIDRFRSRRREKKQQKNNPSP